MSTTPWHEHVLAFECQGVQLVGVLAEPAQVPLSDTGVVIVTGGPQYRAGAHRLFVRLARALAGAGHPALRFDLRGMGDSEGESPGFEHTAPDIGAAIAALLARCANLRHIMLWGLCDGASAALLYLHATHDARVRGLCLANPWVRSARGLARTRVKHYYTRRLLQREFWLKLLRGGVGLGAVRGLLTNLGTVLCRRRAQAGSPLGFEQRMAQAWQIFDGELLLLLSGNDLAAKEFLDRCADDAAWHAALQHPQLRQAGFAQADHTFSGHAASAWVLAQTVQWLQGLPTPRTAPESDLILRTSPPMNNRPDHQRPRNATTHPRPDLPGLRASRPGQTRAAEQQP
ncbi:hydrolase 1, exosortase A system-associated [Azohydromonas australica]|uniref:hydrolase 1, exosortase A system-associated n=1 Tax=Azohydromonas australica TaxID=364039 RepID=UPI00040B2815|nr:hydrolase 1, exosortase A system-associated [Azohydromonas australica]